MLGCARTAVCCASARKRATNAGSPVNSLRSTFTATGRCRTVSRARHTCPIPPGASRPSRAQRWPGVRCPGSATVLLLPATSSQPVTAGDRTHLERGQSSCDFDEVVVSELLVDVDDDDDDDFGCDFESDFESDFGSDVDLEVDLE